ncbi:hypothetical protein BS17DRAFT_718782, partial [Gyrodon lividus]
ILSITCDNASNNNTMVAELTVLKPAFGGSSSHTQCFLHIINLIAKSLIQLLNTKKKDADATLNGVSEELSELAEMCKDMEGIETAGLPHDGEESELDDAAMENDGG